MPIDEFMLNPMLDPFRNMLKEIEDKGITGEHYDAMKQAMDRMEELGREKSDLNDFNGTMMQENLFGTFSDQYGKALAAEAGGGQATDPKDYDDGALLKQMVGALKDAVQRIKDGKEEAIAIGESHDAGAATRAGMEFVQRNKEQYGLGNVSDRQFEAGTREAVQDAEVAQAATPNMTRVEVEALFKDKELIEPIEDLIRLGEEPGMTVPRYLRIQIEKGMDKAMEGNIVFRMGLEYHRKIYEANPFTPYDLPRAEQYLKTYDDLAEKAPFNVPDSLTLQLAQNRIEHEFEPRFIRYNKIKDHWEWIIGRMDQWMAAHSKYAWELFPYVMIPDMAAKKRAIEMDKDCMPGEVKVLLKIFNDYWGMDFMDIFTHETFTHEVKWNFIGESQQYMTWLRDKLYPVCIPLTHPSEELKQEWDTMYEQRKMSNPLAHLQQERYKKCMDEVFGEGYYETKFGPMQKNDSTAEPWDLGSF